MLDTDKYRDTINIPSKKVLVMNKIGYKMRKYV